MVKFRQRIEIGTNVTGIMRLPCVFSCYKEGGGVVYILQEWDSDGNRLEARQGDWLCEDYDGRWTVQKGNSDEGTDD